MEELEKKMEELEKRLFTIFMGQLLKLDVQFVDTGLDTIVGYWIECAICHKKLTSPTDEVFDDRHHREEHNEIRKNVMFYHESVTGHDSFMLQNVIRHLQCYVCKENPPKGSITEQGAWFELHKATTGHRFVAISEN